jgi:putative acetyltransferase
MNVRHFMPEDAAQIAQLFHDTIHTVNSRDYSPIQLAAWAPDDLQFYDWVAFCSSRITFVVDDRGTIAGFANLEPDGHIDCFYCHKDYQRRGVGTLLYQAVEQQALKLGCDRLFTEASITAKPFFQRLGFTVIQQQTVTRRGEAFINYRMEKLITASSGMYP